MSGRFELEEIPGSGAHATIAFARDWAFGGTRVSLKVLASEYGSTSDAAQRVRDEARLLERLNHPSIVEMKEWLLIEGRHVLVMECVDGSPIANVLRRTGAMHREVALEISARIAEAAAYAFQADRGDGEPLQLVHRDLNLSNVMLSREGAIKVLDYGTAWASFDDRETHTKVVLRGTAGYTAPEGLGAYEEPIKIDVYSIGVCLLYMLTGHLPVLSHRRERHAAGLRELLEHVDGEGEELKVLASRLCAYDPVDRPGIVEVAECLRQLAGAVDLSPFSSRVLGARCEPDGSVRSHPSYPDLRFLETAAEIGMRDQDLRGIVVQPDWYTREGELRWSMASAPHWTAAPLVAYLDRADPPWWRLWNTRPHPEGVVLALRLLAYRPGRAALAIGQRLRAHPNRAIAEASRALIEMNCE